MDVSSCILGKLGGVPANRGGSKQAYLQLKTNHNSVDVRLYKSSDQTSNSG